MKCYGCIQDKMQSCTIKWLILRVRNIQLTITKLLFSPTSGYALCKYFEVSINYFILIEFPSEC